MQLRDLRLLDPVLATSYPSAILARDSALVLNLEFIKCIITTEYALVLSPGECDVATAVITAVLESTGGMLVIASLSRGLLGFKGI